MAPSPRAILVTGGAGFIGSNFVLEAVRAGACTRVVNLDRLTYAGNLDNLAPIRRTSAPRLRARRHLRPRALRELADRAPPGRRRQLRGRVARGSLDRRPGGVHPDQRRRHLRAARGHPRPCRGAARRPRPRAFASSTSRPTRSTARSGPRDCSRRQSRFAPNSPYAASKAAADHLVRAYHHTYGLPAVTTNCSNNYGPSSSPRSSSR